MASNPRILLVDDDAAVLEISAEVLSAAGFSVETALDGLAALARLESDSGFHGLVTDDSMPHLSGRELIVRALSARPELRCLLISGRGDAAEATSSFRILRKPFRASALAAAVSVMMAAKPR